MGIGKGTINEAQEALTLQVMIDTLVYIKILFIKTCQEESVDTIHEVGENICSVVTDQGSYTEYPENNKNHI